MEIFLSVVHVGLCFFMILVILLQPGREGGMGGALGGGAATSAFGGQGATTFLSKLTAGCAIAFFATSLLLSFVGYQRSVVAGHKPAAVTAPADAPVAEEAEPAGAEPTEEAEVAVPAEEAAPTNAEPNAEAPAEDMPAAEAPASP